MPGPDDVSGSCSPHLIMHDADAVARLVMLQHVVLSRSQVVSVRKCTLFLTLAHHLRMWPPFCPQASHQEVLQAAILVRLSQQLRCPLAPLLLLAYVANCWRFTKNTVMVVKTVTVAKAEDNDEKARENGENVISFRGIAFEASDMGWP